MTVVCIVRRFLAKYTCRVSNNPKCNLSGTHYFNNRNTKGRHCLNEYTFGFAATNGTMVVVRPLYSAFAFSADPFAHIREVLSDLLTKSPI